MGRAPVLRFLLALPFATLGVPACSGDSAQMIPLPVGGASATEPSPRGDGGAPTSASGVADAGAGAADAGPDAPWPGSQVLFFTFPEQRQGTHPSWGAALTDLVRHLHPTYSQYDYPSERITWGQQVSFGISSHLRFAYNVTGKPANGFYVMKDRATLVVEPAIRLEDVAPRVPASLRGPRYQPYLVTPTRDWNDTPTFVLEEWVSFTNGSEVGVGLVAEGLWGTTTRDAVGGTLELTVYALAFGRAVDELDPTYFTKNPLTREFLAWNAERAMGLYAEGMKVPAFADGANEAYRATWTKAADAAPLRNFARQLFGASYCVKVLGISAAKE
ncbi:MAG: hypothetical protein KF764_30445 [Labilithrix sp.]|nr:hypothetical protein [Labilithrix sp.]